MFVNLALQQAEMRMVRWMCDVKAVDRVPSKELKEKLGIDYIISVLQQNRLVWAWARVVKRRPLDEKMYGV